MSGFEVHFLGTGTGVFNQVNNTACYVLNLNGRSVLMDMGSGSQYRLFKYGYKYDDIDYILLSHAHPDHISDIMIWFQALLYTPGYRRTKPLVIVGPPAVFDYIDSLNNFFRGAFVPKTFEVVRAVLNDRDTYANELFELSVNKMSHYVETLGFRVTACGKTLAYSADTDVCHRLGELIKGADAAIMDATFLAEQKKTGGHMSVMEAAQTAAASGSVKTLVLTHRSPIYDKEQGAAEARAAGFSGEILQPDEGDKLILA